MPLSWLTKALRLLNIDNITNSTSVNSIDIEINEFRMEVNNVFVCSTVQKLAQRYNLKEIKLVHDISFNIMQVLLAECYELFCKYFSDIKATVREILKLEMYHC